MKWATGWAVAGWLLTAFVGQACAQTALSPSPPGAKVYFVDLKDGATIAPKTTIHFGLEGMGVAPAGVEQPNTGHFHLLIDTALPPLDQPIPNDENHLHFGAGQTQATVTLDPGPHTLQLLLGDWQHIPHSPPVFSEVVHIKVAEPAAAPTPTAAASVAAGRSPSPKGAKVYFEAPYNGAYVPETFVVKFGLVGMGVAPAGVDTPNSGHHHLIIDSPLPPFGEPIPNDDNHLHFGAGQSQASVTLPKGKHTLQLLFGDAGHVPHDPPLFSDPIVVYVGLTPPAPPPPKKHKPHLHRAPKPEPQPT